MTSHELGEQIDSFKRKSRRQSLAEIVCSRVFDRPVCSSAPLIFATLVNGAYRK